MALDIDGIDLRQLKWVILMVLFNQPGKEAAFAWMEDIVMDDVNAILH
jgi:Smg protein